MVKRSNSVYGALSCDIASTIPKRNASRNLWIRNSEQYEGQQRPVSFSEGSCSAEKITSEELPPDQGYVKRKTLFFENKPLATLDNSNDLKPQPQETVSRVIKYKVKKPCYQNTPPYRRKELSICNSISYFEASSSLQTNLESGTKSRGLKKPTPRRHTTECILPSIRKDDTWIKKPQESSETDSRKEQKLDDESANRNGGEREIPDKHLPVSSRSGVLVSGCAVPRQSAVHKLNETFRRKDSKTSCDVGAMNDFQQEALSVPRVIAATIKNYRDIPEDLFNSLPESSVDPTPNETGREKTSQWENMLEGRRALLSNETEDTDGELDTKENISPEEYTVHGKPGSFAGEPKGQMKFPDVPQSFRGLGKDLEGIRGRGCGIPTPSRSSSYGSSASSYPQSSNKEYHIQLERELRAAGVYFHLPPPPPPPMQEDTPEGDVSVALATLDASLEGFSSATSSESVSLAHSRASSFADEQSIGRNRGVNAGDDDREMLESSRIHSNVVEKKLFVRSETRDEREKEISSSCVKQIPGNRTVIQLRGSKNKKKSGSTEGEMESLNLIEEVYVTSRTKELPESSVTMKAYYPSVHFSKETSITSVQIGNDNDSGHESGATSPCGTLTGDDTNSPPSSPTSIPKEEAKLGENSSVRTTQTVENEVNPPNSNENPPHSNNTVPDLGTAVVSQYISDETKNLFIDEPPSTHFVVVAIDFGTTYSGYAFSFTRDPENIHMMKKWEGGDPGIQNQKTPTIVLLNPEEEFHSLGFTARDTFHDLDPKEAQKWLYFDRFKMELHSNQALTRDTLLTAKNGKQVQAMSIFVHALRYFKEHAMRELSEQIGIEVEDDDIRWVITVPAIWSHPAKQFMRNAAYQAGMGSPSKQDKLLIALEPEAAAIYCRRLRQNQLILDKSPTVRSKRVSSVPPTATIRSLPGEVFEAPSSLSEMDRGTVYMVVDCGGGTVDITVHQMTDRKCGHLKELHKATGGPYGSIGVDKEFEKLLNLVFGETFMSQFKKERSAAYVDLMVAFESRKRNTSPNKSSPLNIALPFSFIDLYKKTCKSEVETAIKKHSSLGIMWSSQGMLRVDPETMSNLFSPTLKKICEAIRSVLVAPEVSGNIHYMFLVGGFAESELLQNYVKKDFGHEVNVIIPQGMGLAILRGAVQFGLDPSVVTVRRSRMTYGVGILNKYQEGVHPPEKKVVASGNVWCADILDKFVEVDESVAIGDVVARSYTPASNNQKSAILHLYATSEHNVRYVTDPAVQRVGTLKLELERPVESSTESDIVEGKESKPRREITVHLNFGGTEIKASAVDHLTGKCVKANIEFLTL